MPTYLITGCRLMDPSDARSLWGDLWSIGSVFIFNGILDANGQTNWSWLDWEANVQAGRTSSLPGVVSERQVWIDRPEVLFDRRGIVVVPMHLTKLNPSAAIYVGRSVAAQAGQLG